MTTVMSPMRVSGGGDTDRGSQVVSHVLVQILVITVFLALLQLAFALHVRNITWDAASEGARRASLAHSHEDDATRRVSELMSASLAGSVDYATTVRDLPDRVEVLIDATVPLVGPWGIGRGIHAHATSWKEPR